jgi:hypothetical protein
MRLCRKVVYFIGMGSFHDLTQAGTIGNVTVVQVQISLGCVWVLVNVINAVRIERGRPPDNAIYNIPFSKQEFGQE